MIFKHQNIIGVKEHVHRMATAKVTTDTTVTMKLKTFFGKGGASLGNLRVHDYGKRCGGYKKKADMTGLSYQL